MSSKRWKPSFKPVILERLTPDTGHLGSVLPATDQKGPGMCRKGRSGMASASGSDS